VTISGVVTIAGRGKYGCGGEGPMRLGQQPLAARAAICMQHVLLTGGLAGAGWKHARPGASLGCAGLWRWRWSTCVLCQGQWMARTHMDSNGGCLRAACCSSACSALAVAGLTCYFFAAPRHAATWRLPCGASADTHTCLAADCTCQGVDNGWPHTGQQFITCRLCEGLMCTRHGHACARRPFMEGVCAE